LIISKRAKAADGLSVFAALAHFDIPIAACASIDDEDEKAGTRVGIFGSASPRVFPSRASPSEDTRAQGFWQGFWQ
jgi:hypothetical protein